MASSWMAWRIAIGVASSCGDHSTSPARSKGSRASRTAFSPSPASPAADRSGTRAARTASAWASARESGGRASRVSRIAAESDGEISTAPSLTSRSTGTSASRVRRYSTRPAGTGLELVDQCVVDPVRAEHLPGQLRDLGPGEPFQAYLHGALVAAGNGAQLGLPGLDLAAAYGQ